MAILAVAEALAPELSQHRPCRLRQHPVDSLHQLPEDNLRLETTPARPWRLILLAKGDSYQLQVHVTARKTYGSGSNTTMGW